MQTIVYFSIVIPNKTGEGAKVLDALKTAGVNLIALWGYPLPKGKTAQLDIAPGDPKAFIKTIKQLGLDPGVQKTAFHLEGEDRPGVMAEVFAKLAVAGISVHAAQAVCAGAGRFGALIQVADADLKQAKKILASV